VNIAVVLVKDEGVASEPFRVNVFELAPAEFQEALKEFPVTFVKTRLVGVVGGANVVCALKIADEVKPLEFLAVTTIEYVVNACKPPSVTVGGVPLTGVTWDRFTV